MDRKHVFRRSPSLPSSPRNQYLRPRPLSSPATAFAATSNTATMVSRRSPPRGQSMQTTPSSWERSNYRRSYSNDNELVALSSASSSSSAGSCTTKHKITNNLPSSSATIPSGDSEEIPRGSMRKRLAARSSHSGISPKSKKSLSFRRKKKRRGKSGLSPTWSSRNAFKRILVIIFMLFVLSFSMAFLSARNSRRDQKLTKNNFATKFDFHNSVTSVLMDLSSNLAHFTKFLISFLSLEYFPLSNTTNIQKSGLRGTAVSEPSFRRNIPGAPLCTDPLAPDDIDFTVVTQMSLNRLWMMEHHCSRWKGLISIAVYLNDGSSTKASVEAKLDQMGCRLEMINVNVVTGYSEEEYPVNVLRNAALSSVTTSHIVYVDIDFWESVDLRDTLQNHLDRLASDPKAALVIPAFQLNRQCKEWRECPEFNVPLMPKTKDELLSLMIEKRKGSAFDPTNRGGHGSTRYRDWFDQAVDQLVAIECVNSNRYEPYLIVRYCDALPPFQEAFTGYGKNKMTWVMQLRREGYKLLQLGQSFVTHYPHLDSKARMFWNGGKDGKQLRRPSKRASFLDFKRGQIDQTFTDFRAWLEANVPDQTVVPKCHDALNDDEKLWTGDIP